MLNCCYFPALSSPLLLSLTSLFAFEATTRTSRLALAPLQLMIASRCSWWMKIWCFIATRAAHCGRPPWHRQRVPSHRVSFKRCGFFFDHVRSRYCHLLKLDRRVAAGWSLPIRWPQRLRRHFSPANRQIARTGYLFGNCDLLLFGQGMCERHQTTT